MRMLARLVFGALTLLALSFSGSAGPSDYPVLFVHEYCSDGGSWDAMFQNLARRRFGDELVPCIAMPAMRLRYEVTPGRREPRRLRSTFSITTSGPLVPPPWPTSRFGARLRS